MLWHVPKLEAEAETGVGQVCINMRQIVLNKSLCSVELFGHLWRGASKSWNLNV